MGSPEHDIQLGQLRAFVTVARLGSYTRAAELLGYTVPAVHMQLRALQRTIGGSLIKRSGGSMRLTTIGESILPLAEQAVAATAALAEQGTSAARRLSRTIRIGAGHGTGGLVLPRLLPAFEAQHPEITIDTKIMSGSEIIAGLAAGTLDAGLAGSLGRLMEREGCSRGEFSSVHWLPISAVFVAAPGHLRQEATQGLAATITYPDRWEHLAPMIEDAARVQGLTVCASPSDSFEAVKTMALSGRAIGCLPAFLVGLELEVGRLEECLPRPILSDSHIDFVHRRHSAHPCMFAFATFLRDQRREDFQWRPFLLGVTTTVGERGRA